MKRKIGLIVAALVVAIAGAACATPAAGPTPQLPQVPPPQLPTSAAKANEAPVAAPAATCTPTPAGQSPIARTPNDPGNPLPAYNPTPAPTLTGTPTVALKVMRDLALLTDGAFPFVTAGRTDYLSARQISEEISRRPDRAVDAMAIIGPAMANSQFDCVKLWFYLLQSMESAFSRTLDWPRVAEIPLSAMARQVLVKTGADKTRMITVGDALNWLSQHCGSFVDISWEAQSVRVEVRGETPTEYTRAMGELAGGGILFSFLGGQVIVAAAPAAGGWIATSWALAPLVPALTSQ